MLKQSILVLTALVGLAVAFQCVKRQSGYTYSQASSGWDKCDNNGLACCYWINNTVIIYSHGYNEGKYNPNTHCEYIIDLDPDCDIVYCVSMDFSMDGNDQIKIRNLDSSLTFTGSKKPFNAQLDGNKASVSFTSGPDVPAEGSKWAMGIVCVPKVEYKSVCEICDEIADQIEEGPDGDEIIKSLN